LLLVIVASIPIFDRDAIGKLISINYQVRPNSKCNSVPAAKHTSNNLDFT
jgi:hypothetical protein